jgi:UDP-N-acetyl-D-mannosaminuronic acid dehydrogenase
MSINKICIFGLGYVGQTLSIVLAESGSKVIGIEKNIKVVKKLNNYQSNIYEPKINQKLKKIIKKKNFLVKSKLGVNDICDTYIITVGTPLKKNKIVNISMIKNVANTISKVLKDGDLVILRSTVKLKTTNNVVIPILNHSKKKYYISFCPERTIEGYALKELRYLPQIIGAQDYKSYHLSKKIFNLITKKIVRVKDFVTAEMIKLVDNIQRDINFSISNEVAMLSDSFNISAYDVIKYGKLHYPRTNLFYPGPVGGPCLEKDAYIYSESFYKKKPKLSNIARTINKEVQPFVVQIIKNIFKKKNNIKVKKIVICGLAFKGIPETNDVRGTTAVPLILNIRKNFKKAKIYGFDYNVNLDFYKKHNIKKCNTFKQIFFNTDLLIFHNNNKKFSRFDLQSMSNFMSKDSLIYDLWNNFSSKDLILKKNVTYAAFGNLSNLKL